MSYLPLIPDGCQLGLAGKCEWYLKPVTFPPPTGKAGETVYRWNSRAQERADVVLLTGDHPACRTGNPKLLSVNSSTPTRPGSSFTIR